MDAERAEDSLALFLLVVILLGLFVGWITGCAQRPPVTAPVAPKTRITLQAPIAAFVGSGLWVACLVPEDLGDGWITFGLAGHTQRGPMRIEHIQNRLLVEHLSCGTWAAFCEVQTPAGTQRETRPVEVTGLGCDGNSHAERGSHDR